ncbi:MAG TPA: hypothetical protein VLH61_09680 [Bacteroidales bacterium]|nr:hypothetical protein [Bacteroidales bacterium]
MSRLADGFIPPLEGVGGGIFKDISPFSLTALQRRVNRQAGCNLSP